MAECDGCRSGQQQLSIELLQLFVLRLGLLQNRDIRIGILPKRQEILVSGSCFRSVTLKRVSAAQSQPGKGIERAGWINAAMIKNFLILGSRLHAISRIKKS